MIHFIHQSKAYCLLVPDKIYYLHEKTNSFHEAQGIDHPLCGNDQEKEGNIQPYPEIYGQP